MSFVRGSPLYRLIIIHEPNPPRTHPRPRPAAKFLVTFRPLRSGVAGEHALQAHANGLDVLHRAPTLRAEEIEADNAIRIDVWVQGDGSGWCGGRDEVDLGRLCLVRKDAVSRRIKASRELMCFQGSRSEIDPRR